VGDEHHPVLAELTPAFLPEISDDETRQTEIW